MKEEGPHECIARLAGSNHWIGLRLKEKSTNHGFHTPNLWVSCRFCLSNQLWDPTVSFMEPAHSSHLEDTHNLGRPMRLGLLSTCPDLSAFSMFCSSPFVLVAFRNCQIWVSPHPDTTNGTAIFTYIDPFSTTPIYGASGTGLFVR